jgi:DNA-binding GntR family transcriptional regulator
LHAIHKAYVTVKPAPRKPTATERVRSTLADEIVRGDIGPGVILDEVSIAERFCVSRTPVREAIRQLEAIGFAEARPHRGAVVPHFSPEKLTEMFTVMAEMEALCARFAAANPSPLHRDTLQAAHQNCRNLAENGDIAAYQEGNRHFHEAIYAMSGNTFLAEVTRGVRNRLAPFRKAQFNHAGRLMGSIGEHDSIVKAILAGDEAAAARHMRDHMRVVRNSVGKIMHGLGVDA